FFFLTPSPTELSTLSLHDALPICSIWLHRPSVTGSMAVRLAVFQCVPSRTDSIVDLVVPTSRMIWASFSSGWLRTSHLMALGRSDRKSTRLNSSHVKISYAVFCLK